MLKFPIKKKILFIYFYREGREGEREGEKHQCVVASHVASTSDLARNPGMCPDWELNWRPLWFTAHTQSTEPHQLGLTFPYKTKKPKYLNINK